jgi:uncharacterized membrane protein YqjE
MLEIILFILLGLIIFVVSLMALSVMIAYATQSAYDAERDINDD